MINDKMKIDITSTILQEEGHAAGIENIKKTCEKHNISLGIQLHNTSFAEDIELAIETGLPLTAHAPLLSNWQINLAAENIESAEESIRKTVDIMHRAGADTAVFHGFVMTDKPIPAFGRGVSYAEGMKPIFRPELSLEDSVNCCDFSGCDEYKERMRRVKERLCWMREEYPEIKFLVENDFPSYGAGNWFSDTSSFFEHDLCLDSSHLWAAAYLFDRNFLDETKKYIATGRVKMVHLHASAYTCETPKKDWFDGHLPLDTPNSMNLPEFVRICVSGGVDHFVFEIRDVSEADVESFVKMCNGTN